MNIRRPRPLAGCWWLVLALATAAQANLITNGEFGADTAGWTFWFAPGKAMGQATWVARDGGGALDIQVVETDRGSAVQIYQGGLRLERDQLYRVSFDARADEPFELRLRLMHNQPPYHAMGLDAKVPLTPEWRRYTLLAAPPRDDDDARLDFFPDLNCQLDAIEVVAVDRTETTTIRPVSGAAGNGWADPVDRLLDGRPETMFRSLGPADLPLLVAADLGETKHLSLVRVAAFDSSRWSAINRLSVEVSADGQRWHRWATGSRPRLIERDLDYDWVASSLVVAARYLRLRIENVRNSALLRDLEVAVEPDGGVDPAVLPVVDPVEDLVFLGWQYDRLGYAANPGEELALRWRDQGQNTFQVACDWRIETYQGDQLSQGQGQLQVTPRATSSLPIALPPAPYDGPARATVRVGSGGRTERFYFDVRRALESPRKLRLVAMLDNDDAEGWLRMIAGPLADDIEPVRWFSQAVQEDAIVIASEEQSADDPRLAETISRVRAGASALVHGLASPGLDAILPVEIDRGQPFGETAVRLGELATGGPWHRFDPAGGPPHYPVRCRPKPGATVLASWVDGSPAVVEQVIGQGRVVYLATGPGQVWSANPAMRGADEMLLRLLYHVTGHADQVPAMLARAAEVTAGRLGAEVEARGRVAESSPWPVPTDATMTNVGNVGRFGWKLEEGGLVENLASNGRVTCPADQERSLQIWPTGDTALSPRHVTSNWLNHTIAYCDEAGQERLRATVSAASPLLRWQTTAADLTIDAGQISHVVYPVAGGVRAASTTGSVIPGGDLTAGWLLLLDTQSALRDVPRLVVLGRRPRHIDVGRQIRLAFGPDGAGPLWTGRLFGLRRFAPGETSLWLQGLPAEVGSAVERWSRAALSFPVDCDEAAWQDGETVRVVSRFRFEQEASEWDVEPLPLAPLPPVVPLVRLAGAPLAPIAGELVTGLATKYGPLHVVPGDTVGYEIPLPPRDFFGIVPTATMALQDEIDFHATKGIEGVTRASGGLTTTSDFLADLRTYISSGSFPNPFAAPTIDLYKFWYCFPTVTGRQALGSEARARIDAHYREKYWRTLNFYGHKGLVRYRREPWSGLDYAISFIWPVLVQDGVRYFVDQNESAAVIMSCAEAYGRSYGDWASLRANWNLLQRVYEYLPRFHDWAWMASSNQEFFATAGIDMLNSEYPGGLAAALLAAEAGDEVTARQAMVLAAKALVPTVARFAMPAYVRQITAEGDPWRDWRLFYSFHETGLSGDRDIVMRGGPESIMDLALGMLDTSKGTGPRLPLAYACWSPALADEYQRFLGEAEVRFDRPIGWAHLMQRAILGWPREDLVETARRFGETHRSFGWQSTKAPHNLALVDVIDQRLFLSDWTPAEYVAGRVDGARVELRFALHEDRPAVVRLYSQRAVTRLAGLRGWTPEWLYDPRTGWCEVELPGSAGSYTFVLELGDAVAPAHAYFSTEARQP